MDWSLFAELALNGAMAGLMYSLVALGIVLIYKSSSVPNLAQGAMTMLGAYFVLEVARYLHVPMWVAIPLAMLLWVYAGEVAFVVAIALSFAIGVWASQVTGRHLEAPDHRAIVWDEVAAFLLVLYFVGNDWSRIAIAFVLFRIFDIVKPPPIRRVDNTVKNGFGVMADDVLAAGYTLLLLAVWQRVFG